jgi:D-glycero-D-manno-heptose 1,7-bisphosphate phosphatase
MLLLLDRDGVININLPNSVHHIGDFTFLPGSLQALKWLHEAGVTVAVCTNQSCVGRGDVSEQTLQEIHHYMRQTVAENGGEISTIYAATDHPDHRSERFKPGAGMLLEAMEKFNASAHETPFIGDSLRDLQAAQKAGCPPILVRTGHGSNTEKAIQNTALANIPIYDHLLQAVHAYLNERAIGLSPQTKS